MSGSNVVGNLSPDRMTQFCCHGYLPLLVYWFGPFVYCQSSSYHRSCCCCCCYCCCWISSLWTLSWPSFRASVAEVVVSLASGVRAGQRLVGQTGQKCYRVAAGTLRIFVGGDRTSPLAWGKHSPPCSWVGAQWQIVDRNRDRSDGVPRSHVSALGTLYPVGRAVR